MCFSDLLSLITLFLLPPRSLKLAGKEGGGLVLTPPTALCRATTFFKSMFTHIHHSGNQHYTLNWHVPLTSVTTVVLGWIHMCFRISYPDLSTRICQFYDYIPRATDPDPRIWKLFTSSQSIYNQIVIIFVVALYMFT